MIIPVFDDSRTYIVGHPGFDHWVQEPGFDLCQGPFEQVQRLYQCFAIITL